MNIWFYLLNIFYEIDSESFFQTERVSFFSERSSTFFLYRKFFYNTQTYYKYIYYTYSALTYYSTVFNYHINLVILNESIRYILNRTYFFIIWFFFIYNICHISIIYLLLRIAVNMSEFQMPLARGRQDLC